MSTLRQSADEIQRIVAGQITRALGVIKTPWLRRHLPPLGSWLAKVFDRLPHRDRVLHRGRLRLGMPVKHVGATERFGAELRALRDVDVSPELVSDIETELRWGLIWHDFERTMQDEIDEVFAKYLPAPEYADFDDLREMIGLSEVESQEAGASPVVSRRLAPVAA